MRIGVPLETRPEEFRVAVTPETVKAGYETYLAKLQLKDEWVYKMASLRGDAPETADIAKKAHELLLCSDTNEPEKTSKGFTGLLQSGTTLNISEPITVATKDISPEILHLLETLPVATYSEPIPQKSRSDGSTVYRMFYVVEHKKDTPPPFEELSSKIHETLVQRYGDLQREEYFNKLRKKFFLDDAVVNNLFAPSYQPFTICGS